jgi:hypothetical protein
LGYLGQKEKAELNEVYICEIFGRISVQLPRTKLTMHQNRNFLPGGGTGLFEGRLLGDFDGCRVGLLRDEMI